MLDLTHVSEYRKPTAVVVLIILLLWESAHPFFHFFRRKPGQRLQHGLRNVLLGLLNAAMVAGVFVWTWFAVATWTTQYQFGLLHWLPLSPLVATLTAVLILDCWTYWWHRMNHEIPFFWRFHQVHHSDPNMDVTTANRFHIGEIALSSLLRIPILALSGIQLWQLALYETLMFAVVQFHHANISLPPRLDQGLSWFITTPNMHKVHHSRHQPETDSNYTAFLSIWDRLFRSYQKLAHPETIQFGLEGKDSMDQQKLSGLMKDPWQK